MNFATHRWLALLALAAFALFAHAAGPIRIGSVVSATGSASIIGDPQLKTLQMYVDSINRQGGVLGRQLELVSYDDTSDVNKANSFTKRLLANDHVDVIIGGSMSGAAMSMIPLVEQAEVPFITMAGAISIVEPVKKWVFKTSLTDRIVAEMVFRNMHKRGITKIALLSENSGYGQSGKTQSEAVAPKYDVQIVAREVYGATDVDTTAQLARIKQDADVQAIFVFGAGQGPAVVTRNYRQLAMTRPLYQSYAVCSNDFIRLSGEAANGTLLPCTAMLVADALPDSNPQKAVVSGYATAYRNLWKSDVSHFGGCAFDALMLYIDAVKRVGSTDKAKVRDALEQTKGMVLTAGTYNMSSTDHMGLDVNAYPMLEIRNGSWALAH
ncbi:MAG: ABC transporter substrate-binding protein [Burkholderiaceae bacterium]|jgi:branched-chain amino acid transport system substrate-binding protein|nr:ABC transporter substrate-binding protein [Burkholderiaceae bacterium]